MRAFKIEFSLASYLFLRKSLIRLKFSLVSCVYELLFLSANWPLFMEFISQNGLRINSVTAEEAAMLANDLCLSARLIFVLTVCVCVWSLRPKCKCLAASQILLFYYEGQPSNIVNMKSKQWPSPLSSSSPPLSPFQRIRLIAAYKHSDIFW